MDKYWGYDTKTRKFCPLNSEPLSLFPTIMDSQTRTVYCRRCHRWEYILGFSKNKVLTQCGQVYDGPFKKEGTILDYGSIVFLRGDDYIFQRRMQSVVPKNRKLYEEKYYLSMRERKLYEGDKELHPSASLSSYPPMPICNQLIDELGAEYKELYGCKPGVSSSLTGFDLVLGYLLCPFNVNFIKIARHWGLNPYDKDFTSLSSGDTPTAENEMFACINVKPTKALRKQYQKDPKTVVCVGAMRSVGFTDVNILLKATSKPMYDMLCRWNVSLAGGEVTFYAKDGMEAFVADILQLGDSQATVWKSFERTLKYLQNRTVTNITIGDAFHGYSLLHEHLSDKEKRDILHEGFNNYTHDFIYRKLAQLGIIDQSHGIELKNIFFDLEQKFLDLEYKTGDDHVTRRNANGEIVTEQVKDEDRFCFYVAKTSEELRTVGSEMHNCVGWGYANSVQKRNCTIVYAKYKKKYVICIEVTPYMSIRQSLGPCNAALTGASLEAYHEWCKAKHIKFVKAFNIHCAP